MAEIVIGIRLRDCPRITATPEAGVDSGLSLPSREVSIVKCSDEELEAYAEELRCLCRSTSSASGGGGQPMTFERFLRWKALNDIDFLIERRHSQWMWFLERERELRRREAAQ